MSRQTKAPVGHEDLFDGRCQALVRIALQLTWGDPEEDRCARWVTVTYYRV